VRELSLLSLHRKEGRGEGPEVQKGSGGESARERRQVCVREGASE